MNSTDTSDSAMQVSPAFAAAMLSEVEKWGACLMQATTDPQGQLHISVLTQITATDNEKSATDGEQDVRWITEPDSSNASDWSVSLLLNRITK